MCSHKCMHVVVIFAFNFWNTNCNIAHIYSLCENKIEVAGAQALAEGLQHCTNLQKLK